MHKRSLACTTAVACALAAPLVARIPSPPTPQQEMEVAAALELGIDENMFTVNGTTRFLVFVSYFDAMDVSATNLHSDFAYLRLKGVDGVRIFPNWWDVRQDVWTYPSTTYYFAADTLVAPNGTLRSSSLTKFREVLDIAKQEGLLVDVSFSAESVAECASGNCPAGAPDGAYLSLTNYRNAVANVAGILAGAGSAYKHVLFDLQNEYNLNGAGGASAFTDAQILAIRNAVKAVDPHRIVTASLSSDLTAGLAAAKETSADVDVIAWHESRGEGFWNVVDEAVYAIQNVNPDPPIYLQEPQRLRQANQSWLNRQGFGADVRGAYVSGAAAWCFHNGGGFRMDGSKLQSKLQAEEKSFLTCLVSYVYSGSCQ